MALMTMKEYYDSLKALHPTAYILGEKVKDPHSHPLIKHMVAGVAKTFDLASSTRAGTTSSPRSECLSF